MDTPRTLTCISIGELIDDLVGRVWVGMCGTAAANGGDDVDAGVEHVGEFVRGLEAPAITDGGALIGSEIPRKLHPTTSSAGRITRPCATSS